MRLNLSAALLGAATVGLPAADQGGYFPPAWGWIALGLLLTAALALGFRARVEPTRLALAFLGGVTSVLLWIALSTIWSASAPHTIDEIERTIIYVAALCALFALVSRQGVPYLLGGVLTAVVAVSGYSLVERLANGAGHNPLTGPLGYWNALGILTAIGILLALGFASAGLPAPVRLGAAASVPLLATTLYYTRSRGALLALGAGLCAVAFLHPMLTGRTRRIVMAAVAVVALAALSGATIHAGGPGKLLGRSYGAFRSAPAAHGQRSERLLTISGNFRSDYWRVAWAQYRAHPWLGSGSGTFELFWDRNRDTFYGARDAHNLYLEALAELGPFGLLLLVGTLLLPFAGLRGSRPEPLRAAAAGAYLAFLLHAGVDWDWEMPAITVSGLFCGGSLVLRARGRVRPVSGAGLGAVLVALAILAAFVTVAYRGNSALQASVDASVNGKLSRAEENARTATRWNPWSSDAWQLLGEAQLAAGDERAARQSFRTGLDKDPQEWKLWYDLARASRGAARRRALAEATRLNRYSLEVLALRDEVFRGSG